MYIFILSKGQSQAGRHALSFLQLSLLYGVHTRFSQHISITWHQVSISKYIYISTVVKLIHIYILPHSLLIIKGGSDMFELYMLYHQNRHVL